ncbi:MurR/RpiR family transcriptional regulator [Sedimentitalea xiamensis]|uniref:MurR/RpiR family transcriptional regulator n=1 Tax=Sedimentitalea xiamensis TaxID=3050037 RepID=UPI0025407539|nr:MurR/RpiR family transcriptional regulator [Sedimentitalea xiamensis]
MPVNACMENKDLDSFVERLRDALASLRPAERRLAEFLLNFPGDLASYQASELGQLAKVSNATVTRTIRKLGYASFDEARRHVRAERQSGAALFQISSHADQSGDQVGIHFEQAIHNIGETGKLIAVSEIDDLARAILSAGQVAFIGFRANRGLATYARFQVGQIIRHAVDLPSPGLTLAEPLSALQMGDVVVYFALPRRVADTQTIIEQVGKCGASLAYVSDDAVDRRTDVTWHFRCSTFAPGPIYNHASVMALIHVLVTRVVELSGEEGRRRLAKIEALHRVLGELEN